MSNILSSVPLVRVKFKRTVNNITVSADHVTAEPTVSYLTAPGQHGFIDLVTVTSQIDPSDVTTGYLDLVATDDPDVLEQFGWTIQFLNSTRPTRVVSVPQSGTGVTTITDLGQTMPSVWLDSLAAFTGPSGTTGQPLATRVYVDDALDAHEAAPDPHPQYALDSDVAAIRQVPSGGTTGQLVTKTSGSYGWADATQASLLTSVTATKIANYSANTGEMVPVDTTGGAVTVTSPSGGAFAVRWRAGTINPTVAAHSGYTINGVSSVTLNLPAAGSNGELVIYQAFGADYQPVGGFKPQSALDTRLTGLVDGGNSLFTQGSVETAPRLMPLGEWAGVSGRLWITYFTPPRATTLSQMSVFTGGTGTGTATLARIALFLVNSDGSLTTVAQTASDTTIGSSTYVENLRAMSTTGGFPSSYSITPGWRYAFGFLQLAATPMAIRGVQVNGAFSSPIVTSYVDSQTDIAASYTNAALNTWYQAPYFTAIQ